MKTLLFIALLIITLLIGYLLLPTSTPSLLTPTPQRVERSDTIQLPPPPQRTIHSLSHDLQKEQESPSVQTLSSKVPLYQTLSIEEASLHHKPRSYVAPVGAVELLSLDLHRGDTLLLPDIEGVDYALDITDIYPHNDGSKSITGRYYDEGIGYTTTITYAKSGSFISLSTTNGSYEIETQEQIGYIYRTHEIRKKMHPNPIDDGIILSTPKSPHTHH
jgi:hypothetical protein